MSEISAGNRQPELQTNSAHRTKYASDGDYEKGAMALFGENIAGILFVNLMIVKNYVAEFVGNAAKIQHQNNFREHRCRILRRIKQ
jgi:hypothetical protein